jgi:hypothetical protein
MFIPLLNTYNLKADFWLSDNLHDDSLQSQFPFRASEVYFNRQFRYRFMLLINYNRTFQTHHTYFLQLHIIKIAVLFL